MRGGESRAHLVVGDLHFNLGVPGLGLKLVLYFFRGRPAGFRLLFYGGRVKSRYEMRSSGALGGDVLQDCMCWLSL